MLNQCDFVHLYRDLWQAQAELLRGQKYPFGGQVLDNCCHVDNVLTYQEGRVGRRRDPVVKFQNWGVGDWGTRPLRLEKEMIVKFLLQHFFLSEEILTPTGLDLHLLLCLPEAVLRDTIVLLQLGIEVFHQKPRACRLVSNHDTHPNAANQRRNAVQDQRHLQTDWRICSSDQVVTQLYNHFSVQERV